MTYLIILYATYSDGTDTKKAMYTANDIDSAVTSFHSYLASYMSNTAVQHVMVTILNDEGKQLRTECYKRPTVS